MTEESELAKLEGFVSTLLEKFSVLKNENRVLLERIDRRDNTIAGLEENLTAMKEERGEISSRVNSLIGKIEEWEQADSNEANRPEQDEEELSHDDEPTPVEEKKDVAIQGNLFSAEASGQ